MDGKDKTINLLRECVKPGTMIHTTMTIDQKLCRFQPEDIMKAVELFYERYYDVFQSKFSATDRATARTVFLEERACTKTMSMHCLKAGKA